VRAARLAQVVPHGVLGVDAGGGRHGRTGRPAGRDRGRGKHRPEKSRLRATHEARKIGLLLERWGRLRSRSEIAFRPYMLRVPVPETPIAPRMLLLGLAPQT